MIEGGEDLKDKTPDGELGRNGGDKEDLLDSITRNLDQEAAYLLRKRRNVEASLAQEGTYASAAAPSMLCSACSTAAHIHIHKPDIIDFSVRLDQDDNFLQFLGQITTLTRNTKIVDQFFVINPVIIGYQKKDCITNPLMDCIELNC